MTKKWGDTEHRVRRLNIVGIGILGGKNEERETWRDRWQKKCLALVKDMNPQIQGSLWCGNQEK